MKTKLKRASLIVCAALIAASLTACGGNNNNNESNSSSSPSGSASAGQSTAGAKVSDTELKLHILRDEHPNQPIKANATAFQEIFNKTNIKLEFEAVPQANYADKKKIIMSTNNLPDVIKVSRQDVNDFANSGIFLNLSDYIDKYAPNFKKIVDANPEINKLKVDGKLYAFPTIRRWGYVNGYGPVIRKDLLKENNLSEPTTFDELYTVLKQLKEIYPDSAPFTTRYGTSNLMNTIAYPMGSGNGVYYDKDVNGGQFVYGPATNEYKNVLSYLNKMFEDGILDPDYAVNTAQQWQEKLTSGKSFFYYDNSGFSIPYGTTLKQSDPEADLSIINVPKNSNGTARNFFYPINIWDDQFAISAKVKNPETVVKFFDWMYSDEGADVTNFGVLNQDYTMDGGTFKVNPELKEKFKSASDPFKAYQSELGTGQLSFVTYLDDHALLDFDPSFVPLYEFVKNDPAMVEPVLDPPFTADEAKRVKELRTKLDNLLNPELDKYIMGTKPIDDYDKVIEQLKKQGSDELQQIYNDALARVQ